MHSDSLSSKDSLGRINCIGPGEQRQKLNTNPNAVCLREVKGYRSKFLCVVIPLGGRELWVEVLILCILNLANPLHYSVQVPESAFRLLLWLMNKCKWHLPYFKNTACQVNLFLAYCWNVQTVQRKCFLKRITLRVKVTDRWRGNPAQGLIYEHMQHL